MKIKVLSITVAIILTSLMISNIVISQMNHNMAAVFDGILTEPGNDVFGTIQEVISKLDADPNTDWSKVNITALREHLLDMNDMTMNVEIISIKEIENGSEIVLRATTPRATEALDRVFKAHPAQLELETAWIMEVSQNNEQYKLITTTNNPEEVAKIRGLGYIGLMAYGSHHQSHHWSMATGINPHEQHNMGNQ